MKKLLTLLILLSSVLSIKAADYYAINDGNWSTASNWSSTSGGAPSSQAPKKGDVIYIESYNIILDIDLLAEPGISLSIDIGGSLISAGTEGFYIKTGGFLDVHGFVRVGTIDMKNDAVINIYSEARLVIDTWINDDNLVYCNGELEVSGTFTNSGTLVGTGNVTAGHYENTGSIFCITTNPPDGATVYGNGWTGGTPGFEYDWDVATNWCSGYVPGDSVRVTIESSALYDSIIVPSTARCRSLNLEPGISLTIAPASSLTIVDTLWNAGTLTLQSDATGSAKLMDGGVIYGAGDFNVEVYLADSSSTTAYYHQVCAPVDNQILDDFDAVHGFTYAFEYNPSTGEWVNIYGEWRSIPPMKGILLSTLNSSNTPNTLVFTDSLITGDRSVTVEANAWNLIGNPYPSAISWDNINPFTGVNNIVYIWDPISENFVSYVEASGGNVSCQYIQPGQSFFIYSASATSFQLTNSARVITSAPFLKSEPTNYLRLYTSGGNKSSDETYIHLLEGATTSYDVNLEAEKWYSLSETPVTQLYTVSQDNISLQINAMPLLAKGSETVPLHFLPAVSGSYTIHSEYANSFDPSVAIYLEDKMYTPSLMINLRVQGSYTFSAAPGNNPDRFVLHISNAPNFGIAEIQESTIRLGQRSGQFIIENPEQEKILEVKVFSITGSEIANYGPSSSSNKAYDIPGAHASYIVRILTKEEVISRMLINR